MDITTKQSKLKDYHPNKKFDKIPPKPEDISDNGYWCYFSGWNENNIEGQWTWVSYVINSPRYDISLYVNLKK